MSYPLVDILRVITRDFPNLVPLSSLLWQLAAWSLLFGPFSVLVHDMRVFVLISFLPSPPLFLLLHLAIFMYFCKLRFILLLL